MGNVNRGIGENTENDGRNGERKKGLIIVGHGSKLRYYREVMEFHRDRILKAGFFDEVELAFAAHGRKPTVDEVVKKMESSEIYLVPLFMAYGVHTAEELPELLGFEFKEGAVELEINGKKVILCEPVGKDGLVTHAILNRVISAKNELGF